MAICYRFVILVFTFMLAACTTLSEEVKSKQLVVNQDYTTSTEFMFTQGDLQLKPGKLIYKKGIYKPVQVNAFGEVFYFAPNSIIYQREGEATSSLLNGAIIVKKNGKLSGAANVKKKHSASKSKKLRFAFISKSLDGMDYQIISK